MKGIRRIAVFMFISLILPLVGLADRMVSIPTDVSDMSRKELEDVAIDFFSIKCGIERSSLEKASFEISLQQPQIMTHNDANQTVWVNISEPIWIIHLTGIFDKNVHHEGYHQLILSRNGDLLSWQAHGAEFDTYSPDLLNTGTPVKPSQGDVSKEEIIQIVCKDLSHTNHNINMNQYSFSAVFIKEEHVNDGMVPFWCIYISCDQDVLWKGLYSYLGECISLVEANQDYRCYTSPDEEFFASVFGENWWNEAEKYAKIKEGLVSIEERNEIILYWQPLYLEWKSKHHYSPQIEELDLLFE